jgi:DNA-binding winged helix-turn-helix (wHTH) protein
MHIYQNGWGWRFSNSRINFGKDTLFPSELEGKLLHAPFYPASNQLQFIDPITHAYWQHLQANPIPERQLALLILKTLAFETGDAPSAVQGTLWLDIKRCYVEYTQARRVYTNILTKSWIPVLEQFGFRCFDTIKLDGKEYTAMVNDFGPQLVPGWLAGLVDTQLGLNRAAVFNIEARELILGDSHIGLTPLEFNLVQYLDKHERKAVSREELLNTVWGYDYDGGSNVMDVIVRSLRKKLGNQARAIETVAGVGYLCVGQINLILVIKRELSAAICVAIELTHIGVWIGLLLVDLY